MQGITDCNLIHLIKPKLVRIIDKVSYLAICPISKYKKAQFLVIKIEKLGFSLNSRKAHDCGKS